MLFNKIMKNKPRFHNDISMNYVVHKTLCRYMKVDRVLRDIKEDVEELGRKILLVWNVGAIEILH